MSQRREGAAGSPDDALLARARDGDHAAFRRLVERYQNRIAATAVGMLGPGPEAEDVGQETFVRFYRALDRFRGDAALGTYLTRIAINLALEAIERRKRWRRRFVRPEDDALDRLGPRGDAEAEIEARERSRLVRVAIDRLEPHHRSVVVLRMIEGYSTRETAEILDVAEGTVMSRLSRAKAELERQLAPLLGIEDETSTDEVTDERRS